MNKMSVISSQINEAMRSETDLLRSEMLDCSKYAPAYTSPSIYPTSDTYSSPGNVNMQSGYDSLPTKESCYSSYDPVSGILRLQGCKSW